MRRLAGWIAVTLGCLSGAAVSASREGEGPAVGGVRQQSNTAATPIYIVAHQDDWQLFMGDDVASRLGTGAPATFIYLTAGDDGRDSTYWVTREQAALESTRIASGAYVRGKDPTCDRTRITAHIVRRCRLGYTTSYFLRLPDGKRNGAGFARAGFQSMRKLQRKKLASLNAVDRSTAYAGWPDLVATVDALARAASVDSKPVLYSTDPSIGINPHDHFDHRVAGLLVDEIRKRHSWPARYYVGYALASRAANRPAKLTQLKTAVFRAYDDVMIRANPAWSAYAEHPAFYSECMQRTYSRSVPGQVHP
jgi:LmbE family N-acetylglucosaminyl deacetylase